MSTYPEVPGASKSSKAQEANHVPSSPPAGYLDSLPGYEGTSFEEDTGQISPPPYELIYPEVFPMRPPIQSHALTEQEAREAFVKFSQSHCCYGEGAAKNCVISDIQNTSAYHYCLETFAEGRKTNWKHQPYEGEPIPIFVTPPPGPWEIPVTDFNYFQDGKRRLVIPETTVVKECHACEGRGECKCKQCSGWGKIQCANCEGRGHKGADGGPQQCTTCEGYGKKVCPSCSGKDRLPCHTCKSRKKLKYYIELEVTWKTFKNHHVVEQSDLPKHLITGVTGNVIFQEELPQIAAISNFPDKEVNSGSADVLAKQLEEVTKTHRIIRQRHTLSVVPVSQINYQWKGNRKYFFVYGTEKDAYDPDYPQKCCCGVCTVL
uniref:Protein SSUH2 n=1 Tax=Hemiscolopendra marginata TaxID=943146 RepID=A0A646QFY3_9MYRI